MFMHWLSLNYFFIKIKDFFSLPAIAALAYTPVEAPLYLMEAPSPSHFQELIYAQSNERSLSTKRKQVLIADDNEIVREGLKQIIDEWPGLKVVGEAVDGEDVLAQTRRLQPDAVVMDLRMPRMNGIDATRKLKQEFPEVLVVGLSVFGDEELETLMVEAGAAACIIKGDPAEVLCNALLQGEEL